MAALSQEQSALVEGIYASLMKLDGYRILAPAIRDDIFQSISRSADLWFQLLLTGEPDAEALMTEIENAARRRVHQHVPMQAMLRAFQLGAREIWRASAELARADQALADELLFKISPYLFDYSDRVAQVITRAYMAEQYQQARWRDSVLHQLYTVVFHTPDDEESFASALHALGLDATVPRAAIAIDAALDTLQPDVRNGELDRLALTVARHFDVAPDMLIQLWHRGRAIHWIPCAHGASLSQCDRAASERAERAGATAEAIRAIGIGLMNCGAAGWAVSANEAIRAMEISARGPAHRKVFRYSSIALEESARHTPGVLRYLVSLVEQLASDPDLLATLIAFFAEGRRRRATADTLGIHPNTLNYRIERIENLLGASLDDAEWIAKLDIALKLRPGIA